ncbi:MAG: RsmB/NOP family class I SAM-dependent RNA methyltransferase [Planktomarina sp.]
MPTPRASSAPTPARSLAVWLLNGVTAEHETFAELMQKPRVQAAKPEERARAQRLAMATLRYAGRADKLLRPHIAKRPPASVENTLRLGVVEVLHFGAPLPAVTNDLVNLVAAASRTRPMKGLVNAVLRKAVQAGAGKWDKSPVPTLPKWLRKPLMEAYGNATMMGIEVAHMRGGTLDLTVKSDPDGWAARLGGQTLPNGTVRLDGGQVSNLAGFDTGDWWVQDAAAKFAADWLAPQPGQTALDLCAAPGGKTMQLAHMGADVTAVDVSEKRMERLAENLERTRLKAKTVAQSVFDLPDQTYDTVLLDAPCSATGTIRRHPDLPFAKDGSGISELIDLQDQMLTHAANLVKPGGRLLFCTCSLIPDEGEVHAEEFLKTHTDFKAVDTLPEGADPAWRTEEGGMRLRPDYWSEVGGMDGFYMICMGKTQ